MTIAKKLRVCLALLAGLSIIGPAAAQGLTKIKIAISSPSIPASTARIIKQMGLFEKHGLDAAITMMDSGNVATMALISGSINFASSAATDAIFSQARGQDVVALVEGYHGFAGVVVLAKSVADKLGVSASAPAAERFKALNGLTIGSPSPTSSYTLGVKLPAESLGAKVNFVYMSQPAMVAALQTGSIQGYIAGAPYYAQPVINGGGVIWLDGPKGEFPPQFVPANATVLLALRAYAVAHPDIVQRMNEAFLDFGKAAVERPADVKAAIAKLYPDVQPKLLDVIFESEVHSFSIGKLTVEEIAHDLELMKATGVDLSRVADMKPSAFLYP